MKYLELKEVLRLRSNQNIDAQIKFRENRIGLHSLKELGRGCGCECDNCKVIQSEIDQIKAKFKIA